MLLSYLESVDVEEVLEDVSDDLLEEIGKHVPVEKIDSREPSYEDLKSRHGDIRDGLMAARHKIDRGDGDDAREIIEDLIEDLDD